jgi:LysR family transcriptional regulator, transcriptional activator of the cysJI operon
MVTIVVYNSLTMDVRGLEVFLSVAKHLNYTRAGKEVNLSQPSVSVRIRQLEAELGTKLFEQLGKRVSLTEAGLVLIPHARRVISAVENAQAAIDELLGLERGALRIGASTTPGMYLIPQIVARFKELYPRIEVHLGIKATRQVEEGIISNEFDFGFVGGHLAGDEIDVLPWLTDQLVLVVAPNHRLARKKSVNTDDLRKEHFILRESGSATRAAIATHLEYAHFQVEPVIQMDNPESVKRAVQSGLGIAFISRFAVESELRARTLIAVNVKGLAINRELKIVYRKDKHLGRAAQAFIEISGSKQPG